MNGPEHYREAEKWIANAARWHRNAEDVESVQAVQAAAAIGHTHATLALAAEKRKPLVIVNNGSPMDPEEASEFASQIRAAWDEVSP